MAMDQSWRAGLRALAASTLVMVSALGSSGTATVELSRAEHDVRLEVDLSERVLRVYQAGSLMNSFPVAVGEPDHPTPRGTFSIDRIVWNPDWVPPAEEWAKDETRRAPDDPENPMVGAKLFFQYPDYYIHGTNAPGTMGQAASHGCIRMRPSEVVDLAKFIQVQGGRSRSDGWFERVARNDGTSDTVTLPAPIELVIRD